MHKEYEMTGNKLRAKIDLKRGIQNNMENQ